MSQLFRTISFWLVAATLVNATVTITEQPTDSFVPLAKETRLNVLAEGSGNITYQWYKNGVPISLATNAQLDLQAFSKTQSNNYQVKVTDSDSEVWSEVVKLDAFEVAEQLGSPELTFTFEDSPSDKYTRMIPEDGTGIGLEATTVGRPDEYQTAPSSITLHTQGPAVISFEATQRLKTTSWELSYWGANQYFIFASEGDWVDGATVVTTSGPIEVTWETQLINAHDWPTGSLRNVKVQKTPSLRYPLFDSPIHSGATSSIIASIATLGTTRAYLMKNGIKEKELTVLENQEVHIEWLPEVEEGTANYSLRLENEFGEYESDPFQIFVGAPPKDGFDFESIFYNTGFSAPDVHDLLPPIWYTQTSDTHDGIDAIMFKKGPHNEPKELKVEVAAPAWLSFWWKNPGAKGILFKAYDTHWLMESPEWKQFKILIQDAPLTVRWIRAWEGAIMDELVVDYLEDNPFKEWLYSQLLEVDFEIIPQTITIDDYDNDGKSNLIEWALAGDPLTADTLPQPILTTEGTHTFTSFAFESPTNLGPYSITLESSDNLSNWMKIEAIVSEEAIPNTDLVLRTLQDPTPIHPTSPYFLRIRVSHSSN